ncbi:hypothetical protein TGS27_0841 [Geobacillus stearothermophilus]|nr:hypothetical protein AA904_15905 [Geobacillus stearothermophilus]KMY57122.1 hypothetical protein AA906_14505 [Geobacillus stearothermophilus]KMY59475.1 hypothetical protein AA905_11710 [Geobacillus stearothermophilus]OAO84721.1 hypothetical protein TGS27_0841 [Geobacillus stearothermophilus]
MKKGAHTEVIVLRCMYIEYRSIRTAFLLYMLFRLLLLRSNHLCVPLFHFFFLLFVFDKCCFYSNI